MTASRLQPAALVASLLSTSCTVAQATPPPRSFSCTEARLLGVHKSTLRVYRNEVFARHGRSFRSADLQAFYGQTGWYRPDPAYTDGRLTDDDHACLNLLKGLEAAEPVAPTVPDLDSDGTPDPIQWNGHTLQIGPHKAVLGEHPVDGLDRWNPPQIIDLVLEDGLQEVVLTTDPGVTDEWQFTVVRFDKGRIEVLMDNPEWMDHQTYTAQAGALVHVSVNCGQETTRRWTLSAGRLVKTTTAKGTYNAELCAACPFVFRLDDQGAAKVGEVLRNQRRPELEAADRLPLGQVTAGRLVVRLLELKPETTFLDRIAVEVDGEPVHPVQCSAQEPAFCEDDGIYTRIDADRDLTLEFVLPQGGRGVLVADGYYAPHEAVVELPGQLALRPVDGPGERLSSIPE